jgi:hypothetical protein
MAKKKLARSQSRKHPKNQTTKTSKIKVLASEKRKFETGANRQDDSGKGMPSLCSPLSDRILAKHMQGGVEAGYDPRNWEKGLPLASIVDSIERHVLDIKEGKCDENHFASLLWNAHILVHTNEMIRRGLLPKELNNLQNYIPKKCPKHPRYKAKRATTRDCDICQMIFDNKKQVK